MTRSILPAMNHRSTFLNEPSDCEWLLSTALKQVQGVRPFASFVLVGNEDSPEAVYLYPDADPLVSDEATLINFGDMQ